MNGPKRSIEFGTRSIPAMGGLLVKLVSLSASLMAVVPPGACCADFATNKSASPSGSCCRAVKVLSEEPPRPAAPRTVDCCCRQEAVTRGEQVAPLDFAAALPIWATCDVGVPPVEATGPRPAPEEMAPGPPRHLVQCVWLC